MMAMGAVVLSQMVSGQRLLMQTFLLHRISKLWLLTHSMFMHRIAGQRLRSSRRLSLISVLLMSLSVPANATTVLQLSFEEVVDSAELIFEGRVTDVEAVQTGPRSIHTKVTFEVISVIKGNYANTFITLQFLGGEVDGRSLVVQGMQMPAYGDTGIFFVESLQDTLIHPLVGWSQGHFLLETDASGERRVLTADHAPVTGIAMTVEAQTGTNIESPDDALLVLDDNGAALGVLVQQNVLAHSAMIAEAFRGQLQSVLEIQRQDPE
jgi:hypothetical protein